MSYHRPLLISYVVAALTALPGSAISDVPDRLPLQGFLTDDTGHVVNGPTMLRFSLYETETGGVPSFSETRSVEVDAGVFFVELGATAAFDPSIVPDSGVLYLGVTVASGTELSPRIRLGALPYAVRSAYCEEASTLGGATAADFAETAHGHAFFELTDVPAGLLDGDDDTVYSAGAGLVLSPGNLFSVEPSTIESWSRAVCYDSEGELRGVLDDNYSSIGHTHDASALSTGLLATERFNAYADLQDEGRINGDSGTDLVTRDVGDARYLRSGVTLGDLVTSGAYRYSTPRALSLQVPAAAMLVSADTEDELVVRSSSGYLYIGDGISTYGVDLQAPLGLPQGATLTALECFFYDNSAAEDLIASAYLRRRGNLETGATIAASVSMSTSAESSAAVRSASAVIPAGQIVDNALYSYTLQVNWYTGDTTGTSFRFYGCRVGYAVEQAGAP